MNRSRARNGSNRRFLEAAEKNARMSLGPFSNRLEQAWALCIRTAITPLIYPSSSSFKSPTRLDYTSDHYRRRLYYQLCRSRGTNDPFETSSADHRKAKCRTLRNRVIYNAWYIDRVRQSRKITRSRREWEREKEDGYDRRKEARVKESEKRLTRQWCGKTRGRRDGWPRSWRDACGEQVHAAIFRSGIAWVPSVPDDCRCRKELAAAHVREMRGGSPSRQARDRGKME